MSFTPCKKYHGLSQIFQQGNTTLNKRSEKNHNFTKYKRLVICYYHLVSNSKKGVTGMNRFKFLPQESPRKEDGGK